MKILRFNRLPLPQYYRYLCPRFRGITARNIPVPRYYRIFLPHYRGNRYRGDTRYRSLEKFWRDWDEIFTIDTRQVTAQRKCLDFEHHYQRIDAQYLLYKLLIYYLRRCYVNELKQAQK